MLSRPIFRVSGLFLLTATSAVAGWWSSTPSESDAEAYWRSQFGNSNGLIKMASFKKTDGKTVKTEAGDIYALFYTLTFEATDDCQYSENFEAAKGLPQSESDSLGAFGTGKSVAHKGDQFVQAGEMDYEKRESGWVLINLQTQSRTATQATQQKRIDEAAAQRQAEQQRQAQRNAIIAKAKERHRTVFTELLAEDCQAVVSDCDITLVWPRGSRVIWFGNIGSMRSFYPAAPSVMINFTQGGSEQLRCLNKERLDAFLPMLQQTVMEWQRANPDLFPGSRQQTSSQSNQVSQATPTTAAPGGQHLSKEAIAAILAKAKTRQSIKCTESLEGGGKVVMSNCDLSTESSAGTEVTWFGDLAKFTQGPATRIMNIDTRDGRHLVLRFIDDAHEQEFMLNYVQARRQWNSDNAILFQKPATSQ